jgi:hypothetical protein
LESFLRVLPLLFYLLAGSILSLLLLLRLLRPYSFYRLLLYLLFFLRAFTWLSGNLRDHHIGRMAAKPNAPATWVPSFPTFSQSFPYLTSKTYDAELVATSDVKHIKWLASAPVAYIT